ncbi:MAG: 2-dehydropantoate 2-reductase [Burkholderiaceae bacterium]
MSPLRIAVVGAGAIGGLMAARLSRAGHAVSVVARGDHLDAIRGAGGLWVTDRWRGADRWHGRVRAEARPEDLPAQDIVILGLKGPAIPAMLPRLGDLLADGTIVVPAINGVPWWYFHREGSRHDGARIECLDRDSSLFSALDPDRLVGCVVHTAAEVIAPGEIVHTASQMLIVGEPSGEDSDRVRRLARALDSAGFDARVSTRIREDIWTKLVGNLAFNPVAALTGCVLDEIATDEALLTVVRPLIAESLAVASALGVPLSVGVERRIEMAREIGPARLSTLQDFEAGRRPELEGLLDAVIELAQRAGVDVPTIRQVAALARARARTLGLLG